MRIDLTHLPPGATYEDRYGGYLELFKLIAHTPAEQRVEVVNPPASWIPLLWHLSAKTTRFQLHFEHCAQVRALLRATKEMDRTLLEVVCGFRPETTDALWKVDVQWRCAPGRVRRYVPRQEFIVTCNGSFFRPEIFNYEQQLERYVPSKRKLVLVPCAADKPYPSALHRAVLKRMPADYYLANATGVLGIVPQDLWPLMPHYDSGLPNEWRLMRTLRHYLKRFEHERIVVYADYYSEAIYYALESLDMLDRADFVNPVQFYADYLNLLEPQRLQRLEQAFAQEEQPA